MKSFIIVYLLILFCYPSLAQTEKYTGGIISIRQSDSSFDLLRDEQIGIDVILIVTRQPKLHYYVQFKDINLENKYMDFTFWKPSEFVTIHGYINDPSPEFVFNGNIYQISEMLKELGGITISPLNKSEKHSPYYVITNLKPF